MITEMEQLIELSRLFGRDVDLVQGGGGNSSVKLSDGRMLIKASGTTLKAASSETFIAVDPRKVIDILDDDSLSELSIRERDRVMGEKISGTVLVKTDKRPSIEVFLHALLAKYVVHMHPVYVNAMTCMEGGQAVAAELFRDEVEFLWIGYDSPGYPMGKLFKEGVVEYKSKHNEIPKVMFLENHGLIVSSDSPDEINSMSVQIIETLRGYFGDLSLHSEIKKSSEGISPDMWSKVYRAVDINDKVFRVSHSALTNHVVKSSECESFFCAGPLYPDQIVYCGESPLYFTTPPDNNDAFKALREYIERYGYPPKVIVGRGAEVVLVGQNQNEIDTIMEMIETHLKVLSLISKKGKPLFLSRQEGVYLSNWESEKYRRKLMAS